MKYIAYGSNLNVKQMAMRCPMAKRFSKGVIKDYTLVFRTSGTGAYATIIPSPGDQVPVLIWNITQFDEARLDIYEGFPKLYYKKNLKVSLDNGKNITAMAYIMNDQAKPGIPSKYYVDTCLEGYKDNNLDTNVFINFVKNNL